MLGKMYSILRKHLDDKTQVISNNICDRLHELFCSMPRYTWNQISQVPFINGIYMVFEKGKQYHEMDRIVRVRTHKKSDHLKTRLRNHFINESHDGSIFRKNVGKAILNSQCDPYLTNWTINTSKPENRVYLYKEKNVDTEQKVSKFLRENCTFTIFQVMDKDERLRLEEAIIATLNAESEFKPSPNWLGRYSPEYEIHKSGLWLKQGLNKQSLTEEEICKLLNYMKT